MSDIPRIQNKLSMSEKFSRLRLRLQKPEWRRYGAVLLAGKGIGIALVFVAIGLVSVFMGGHTFAADPDLKGNDILNPINTMWTLIAAFLVFGMQVGFTILEAGLCRSVEILKLLMNGLSRTCVVV